MNGFGFRPLAGIMVLIDSNSGHCGYEPHVSVPLRGLWFLSRQQHDEQGKGIVFPSPCGDYGSYLPFGTLIVIDS